MRDSWHKKGGFPLQFIFDPQEKLHYQIRFKQNSYSNFYLINLTCRAFVSHLLLIIQRLAKLSESIFDGQKPLHAQQNYFQHAQLSYKNKGKNAGSIKHFIASLRALALAPDLDIIPALLRIQRHNLLQSTECSFQLRPCCYDYGD